MIMSNTTAPRPRTHHRVSLNETRGLLGFLIWAWLPRCKIFEPKNISLSWGATSSHLLHGDWLPQEAHGRLSRFVTVADTARHSRLRKVNLTPGTALRPRSGLLILQPPCLLWAAPSLHLASGRRNAVTPSRSRHPVSPSVPLHHASLCFRHASLCFPYVSGFTQERKKLWASSPSGFLFFPHIPVRVLGEGTREVIKPVSKIAILESFEENLGLCMAASHLGSLRSESLEDFSPSIFFFLLLFYFLLLFFFFVASLPQSPPPRALSCLRRQESVCRQGRGGDGTTGGWCHSGPGLIVTDCSHLVQRETLGTALTSSRLLPGVGREDRQ